jgi:hypothetical protein
VNIMNIENMMNIVNIPGSDWDNFWADNTLGTNPLTAKCSVFMTGSLLASEPLLTFVD